MGGRGSEKSSRVIEGSKYTLIEENNLINKLCVTITNKWNIFHLSHNITCYSCIMNINIIYILHRFIWDIFHEYSKEKIFQIYFVA